MSNKEIQWTGRTWNPTRGCSRISEGCRNCYAETMAKRFSQPGGHWEGFAGPRGWTGRIELIPEKLTEPLRWRNPQLVFVGSASDIFHEALSNKSIVDIFDAMWQAYGHGHVFQVLTKRAKRMHDLWPILRDALGRWPLPNVWIGTSVENQQTADERIMWLLKTPAAGRFVSYEPGLEGVEFGALLATNADCGDPYHAHGGCGSPGIDLVICGGESGPKARPFDLEWARSARDQCREAGVAFFFKQAGSWPYDGKPLHGIPLMSAGPSAYHARCVTGIHGIDGPGGSNQFEWPEDLRVREMPESWVRLLPPDVLAARGITVR